MKLKKKKKSKTEPSLGISRNCFLFFSCQTFQYENSSEIISQLKQYYHHFLKYILQAEPLPQTSQWFCFCWGKGAGKRAAFTKIAFWRASANLWARRVRSQILNLGKISAASISFWKRHEILSLHKAYKVMHTYYRFLSHCYQEHFSHQDSAVIRHS